MSACLVVLICVLFLLHFVLVVCNVCLLFVVCCLLIVFFVDGDFIVSFSGNYRMARYLLDCWQ